MTFYFRNEETRRHFIFGMKNPEDILFFGMKKPDDILFFGMKKPDDILFSE